MTSKRPARQETQRANASQSRDKMRGVVVKLVESEPELDSAMQVRFRVFVSEQGVPPEEELDEADAKAIHAIALVNRQVVGTGRLLLSDGAYARIGRMAVDLDWRRHGIGSQILSFLEETALAQSARYATLHAQEYVKRFYAAHGYREHGSTFLEANIPHVEMRKEL